MWTYKKNLTLFYYRINPNQLNRSLSLPFSNYVKKWKQKQKRTPGDTSCYNQFDFVTHYGLL